MLMILFISVDGSSLFRRKYYVEGTTVFGLSEGLSGLVIFLIVLASCLAFVLLGCCFFAALDKCSRGRRRRAQARPSRLDDIPLGLYGVPSPAIAVPTPVFSRDPSVLTLPLYSPSAPAGHSRVY